MPVTVAQLRRVRSAVRATLLLGVAASVAANILHAQPNPIAQAIAAWPPVALLLTVELISRVPVDRPALAALRLLTTTGIAGIAAWLSYSHMQGVAARYGETGASPYLLPLSVDGLVVVASVSLVELAGRLRTTDTTTTPNDLAAVVPASRAVPAGTPGPPLPPPTDAALASAASSAPPAVGSALVDPAAGDRAVAGDPVGRTAQPATRDRPVPRRRPPQIAAPAPLAAQTAARHRAPTPNGAAGEPTPTPDGAPPPEDADTPPADTAAAVAYWRTNDPTMSVKEICGKVGRSERTVRRVLDRLAERTPAQSRTGNRAGTVNGSDIAALADAATSR